MNLKNIHVIKLTSKDESLLEKRDDDCAILLVSTELDEVMELSDRIAVMFDGNIIAVIDAEGATKEQIGLLMAGVVEG